MARVMNVSEQTAQNPDFLNKASGVAYRHRRAHRTARRGWMPAISLHGVVRTVLALWCIKIAVVTAQGASVQAEMVAHLEERAPLIAVLAAPDPLTRSALSLRYKAADWKRYIERVM